MEHWYAVQVRTGREEEIAALCRRIIKPETYHDCFIPKYERKRRYEGAWHKEEAILFPGYLFFITEKIEALFQELKRVPEITRILGDGADFIPIHEDEADRLRQIQNEKHLTEMSVGYLIGDQIVITSGPMEKIKGQIVKINRHKRIAIVRMQMFGRETDVALGLEVVKKIPRQSPPIA